MCINWGKRFITVRHILQSLFKNLLEVVLAYNSQSTRIVVLFGESHQSFWDIVKEIQKRHVPSAIFEGVEIKIDQCADAFGTVLFYEDQNTIQQLQKKGAI